MGTEFESITRFASLRLLRVQSASSSSLATTVPAALKRIGLAIYFEESSHLADGGRYRASGSRYTAQKAVWISGRLDIPQLIWRKRVADAQLRRLRGHGIELPRWFAGRQYCSALSLMTSLGRCQRLLRGKDHSVWRLTCVAPLRLTYDVLRGAERCRNQNSGTDPDPPLHAAACGFPQRRFRAHPAGAAS